MKPSIIFCALLLDSAKSPIKLFIKNIPLGCKIIFEHFSFATFAATLAHEMVAKNWQKYLKFRCTGCGNCCRNTVVCVTDDDLRRIADGTGKSPAQFVRFYSRDEVSMAKNDPLWVKFGLKTAVMGLRSRDDHCIFLDSKNNFCTIYEHRPVTCRDYPFKVTVSETGAVQNLSLRRIVKCLHAWDGNSSRRTIRTIHSWNQRQEKGYVKKIKLWNKQKSGSRTRAAFLRFLGFTG